MSGWIKLHRDIQSHWIYSFDEPDKSLAWIDLLLLASHAGGSFMVKGKLIEYKRGQIAISQITLQKRWRMSQNKVKRLLELLKKQSMIDFKTNELTTIITICNYSSFQDDERTDGRPLERPVERATDDQSNDIIRMKERKECKEVNIDSPKRSVSSLLFDFGIDGQLAKDFIALRKEKKAAITETALKRMKTQSDKAGLSMQEAVEICIERNWQGFNAEWYGEKPKQIQKQVITEAEINRAARPGETRDQVYKRLQAAMGM